MEKICESCGMPMQKPEDFGGNKQDNKYCVHCTDEQGNLLPFDEKLKGTTSFIMRMNDVAEAEAVKMAKDMLQKNPAWAHLKE